MADFVKGLLLAFVWLCTARTIHAAPQTFNTALPVAQGEFVFREQFLYRKASDDSSPTDRELKILGSVSVLGYGANGNLALFGILPYLDKELQVTISGDPRVTRDTNGFADISIFGRFTVYQHDAPGRTLRIAPFIGLELPTGDSDDRDSLGVLPAPLQLGSGSWDPLGGVVLTYQTLDYQFDAQASYKHNTEGRSFEFGDEASLDASLQYRLWPRVLDSGVPGFFYGVLESNLLYQGKNKIDGVKTPDSGATSWLLSPGFQYVSKRWILEAIVQVPVAEDLGSAALENDFILRAGFRLNF